MNCSIIRIRIQFTYWLTLTTTDRDSYRLHLVFSLLDNENYLWFRQINPAKKMLERQEKYVRSGGKICWIPPLYSLPYVNLPMLKYRVYSPKFYFFRQQKIKYGAVQGGSTAAFFRVRQKYFSSLLGVKCMYFRDGFYTYILTHLLHIFIWIAILEAWTNIKGNRKSLQSKRINGREIESN